MGTMFLNVSTVGGHKESFCSAALKSFLLSQLWAGGCQISPLFFDFLCLGFSQSFFRSLVTTESHTSNLTEHKSAVLVYTHTVVLQTHTSQSKRLVTHTGRHILLFVSLGTMNDFSCFEKSFTPFAQFKAALLLH